MADGGESLGMETTSCLWFDYWADTSLLNLLILKSNMAQLFSRSVARDIEQEVESHFAMRLIC